ncbi:rhomboid family intramembrane serine protease [Pseudonocardia spinosispora]|uniref:rhomboid family intramembrane serine protease n=1 Tax=Pseudonocardia spinosispora TaxID=103441 RepID=UPI00041986C1|nr:rhomboid family intramembrane serine protease [Pseudonocardia spinosispora]
MSDENLGQRLMDVTGRRPRLPVATPVVWLITATTGIAQLIHPPLYDLFRRDPRALLAGEWWRLVTPLFFQDGWLIGTVCNLTALAMIGVVAEVVLGPGRWLAVYSGCGLFGHLLSYLWLQPVGAGNSMATVGLLGVLATGALLARRRYDVRLPLPVLGMAAALPVLAVVDTVLHDNHGMPALLGMALGLFVGPVPRAWVAQRGTMVRGTDGD